MTSEPVIAPIPKEVATLRPIRCVPLEQIHNGRVQVADELNVLDRHGSHTGNLLSLTDALILLTEIYLDLWIPMDYLLSALRGRSLGPELILIEGCVCVTENVNRGEMWGFITRVNTQCK